MIKEGFLFEIYNKNGRYPLSTNLKIYNTYISCFDNRFDADTNYVNAINILLQEGQPEPTCSFEIYKYNDENLSFIKNWILNLLVLISFIFSEIKFFKQSYN